MRRQRSFGQYKITVLLGVLLVIPIALGSSFTQTLTFDPLSSNSTVIASTRYVCTHDLLSNYFVGLSFTGNPVETAWNYGEEYKLSVTSGDSIYLSFSKGSCVQVRNTALEIGRSLFDDRHFPAFGYGSPPNYKISLILKYPELDFTNQTDAKQGTQLVIRNLGKKDGIVSIETEIK